MTAQKREENLQKVPVAVSVFTSQQRDDIGILTVQDIADFTPGMSYLNSRNGAGRFDCLNRGLERIFLSLVP